MNKAFKAGLLSAFIAPGSGHFYLQYRFRGCLFLGIGVLTLSSFLVQVLQVAQNIALDIEAGTKNFDIGEIAAQVQQSSAALSSNASPSLILFIICWLVAIIDSVRLGNKRDKTANDQPSLP